MRRSGNTQSCAPRNCPPARAQPSADHERVPRVTGSVDAFGAAIRDREGGTGIVRRDRGARSSLSRTHRRQVDQRYREDFAEGTTLSLGGSFTPFAFAMAEAIFSS